MSSINIFAGERASTLIQQEGFSSNLVMNMLGASGGPKWFTLFGLDKYIFGELFKDRDKPLNIMGSSAGAFRFACFAQQNPVAAIERLAERYSQTVYSDNPDAKEITDKGNALLAYVLGKTGAQEIIENPVIKAHFVVARCLGLAKHEQKHLQTLGLVGSAIMNAVNRRNIKHYYERVIFSPQDHQLHLDDPYDLPIVNAQLEQDNLHQALMASGSIPIVIEGVENIVGAPQGMYRDGGIIDYHFDLTVGDQDGIVLYPHFYAHATPGWFDKSLKRRKPHRKSYQNVLMISPSEEFVASLPYGKIPDRKDFETMTATDRIKYWQQVMGESERLADDFANIVANNRMDEVLQPIAFTQ